MVRLSITLHAATARAAEDLIEALQFQVWSTRVEPGCLGCAAWTEPVTTVHYFEDWASEADVRRRVLSDRFTSVLSVVESTVKAHVQFDFVTETRGLDYVEEVRGQSSSPTNQETGAEPA
jgi:quinol monooxygenase YgiN